jgi:hypothetical protein
LLETDGSNSLGHETFASPHLRSSEILKSTNVQNRASFSFRLFRTCPGAPDGTVIYLVFVAPESDYQSLSPTFEKMLHSVQ